MRRILVIDDELCIAELIGDVLQRAGYAVETAYDGQTGIRLFDDRVYDLVITDMGLPDMAGRDLIRHIRNSSRSFTPVIGMSGTPWMLKGVHSDANLPKPFPLRALIESVERLTRFGIAASTTSPVFPFNDQAAV